MNTPKADTENITGQLPVYLPPLADTHFFIQQGLKGEARILRLKSIPNSRPFPVIPGKSKQKNNKNVKLGRFLEHN